MLVSHVHKPEMKNTGVAWVIHMLVLTLQVTSTPPRDRTSERDVSRACMEHAQHGEVTYKRRRRHTRLANAPQQLLRAVVVAAAACCFACRAACGTPCGISIEPVRSIAPGTSCGSTGNGPRARPSSPTGLRRKADEQRCRLVVGRVRCGWHRVAAAALTAPNMAARSFDLHSRREIHRERALSRTRQIGASKVSRGRFAALRGLDASAHVPWWREGPGAGQGRRRAATRRLP